VVWFGSGFMCGLLANRLLRYLSGSLTKLGRDVIFGKHSVAASKIFFSTAHTVVIFETRPIVPGHLVVFPRRCVQRSSELTKIELDDFWRTVHIVQPLTMQRTAATAVNIAMKDGPATCPPIPHLHCHIIPRIKNDFERNDQVYEVMDAWNPVNGEVNQPPPFEFPADESRTDRTAAEMEAESEVYRAAFATVATKHGLVCGELPESQLFSRFSIPTSQIFYSSPSNLTVALVNLRPLCPGHVLVVSKRVVPRIQDLTHEEYHDLWQTVKLVQAVVQECIGADSATIGLQDGPDAGQSVPHCHVHILPRNKG